MAVFAVNLVRLALAVYAFTITFVAGSPITKKADLSTAVNRVERYVPTTLPPPPNEGTGCVIYIARDSNGDPSKPPPPHPCQTQLSKRRADESLANDDPDLEFISSVEKRHGPGHKLHKPQFPSPQMPNSPPPPHNKLQEVPVDPGNRFPIPVNHERDLESGPGEAIREVCPHGVAEKRVPGRRPLNGDVIEVRSAVIDSFADEEDITEKLAREEPQSFQQRADAPSATITVSNGGWRGIIVITGSPTPPPPTTLTVSGGSGGIVVITRSPTPPPLTTLTASGGSGGIIVITASPTPHFEKSLPTEPAILAPANISLHVLPTHTPALLGEKFRPNHGISPYGNGKHSPAKPLPYRFPHPQLPDVKPNFVRARDASSTSILAQSTDSSATPQSSTASLTHSPRPHHTKTHTGKSPWVYTGGLPQVHTWRTDKVSGVFRTTHMHAISDAGTATHTHESHPFHTASHTRTHTQKKHHAQSPHPSQSASHSRKHHHTQSHTFTTSSISAIPTLQAREAFVEPKDWPFSSSPLEVTHTHTPLPNHTASHSGEAIHTHGPPATHITRNRSMHTTRSHAVQTDEARSSNFQKFQVPHHTVVAMTAQ